MSEYVGLKRGKVHESHVISEYYCGGCGWPVTDHDSYCPECGGELHEGMGKNRYAEVIQEGGAMSSDMMSFPNDWWRFVQQYQFADKDEVYTNGSMLIPSFRVRQMVEHYFGGEVGKTSRHSELFGTPERAARTLYESTSECRCCVIRDECGYDLDKCVMYDRNALFEWLRGDAE